MRYIEKQTEPEIFANWKLENKTVIQKWVTDSDKTGDHLWAELGKTFGEEKETEINEKEVRNRLLDHLYHEQHGLCCYCGDRIKRLKTDNSSTWEYRHYAIEHFLPKSKHKHKTFEYQNLMLCCKESQKLGYYEVGRTYHNIQINDFHSIAQITYLHVSAIRTYSKNKDLTFPLKKGAKIYVPNPPHCDDEKSKYDKKEEHTEIICPTNDKDKIDSILFYENGKIGYIDNENGLLKNTIKVLNLNCDTLTERRQEKWLNAYISYYDERIGILQNWLSEFIMQELDDSTIRTLLYARIRKLIQGKETPQNHELEPFYFVEVAFLNSLFNGKKT